MREELENPRAIRGSSPSVRSPKLCRAWVSSAEASEGRRSRLVKRVWINVQTLSGQGREWTGVCGRGRTPG